jgi:hypothetical protein
MFSPAHILLVALIIMIVAFSFIKAFHESITTGGIKTMFIDFIILIALLSASIGVVGYLFK